MEDNRQEDLDLLFVFKSIKKGIVNVFRSLLELAEFSFRHFIIVGLISFLFGAIAYGLYTLRSPCYKSEMCVSHVRFENEYCREMINNLDISLNRSNGNATLGRKLSMSPEYARQVKAISYSPLSEHIASLYSDSLGALLPFKIEVEVYDPSVLDTLQTRIIAYLEANDFASAQKQFDKQSLQKIEQRLDGEIQSLDSLKRKVDKSIVPQSTGNGIILGQPINPVLVYDAVIKLYEKKMEINGKQILNDSFVVMVGFSEGQRSGPGRLLFVAIGLLLGYIIGLLVASRRALAKR